MRVEFEEVAMGRSLQVRADAVCKVKAGLRRNGYARQKDLAEELGIALSTLSNYLNGRPVDYVNFTEISNCLGLDWQAIADLPTTSEPESLPIETSCSIESFIYIERPPIDRICYEALLHPSCLLRIKAPRLMGKTSLVAHLLRQAAHQGYRTVHLNFHLANQADFRSLSAFLQWFCASVTQQLQLPNRLAQYWDEEFSTNKISCTEYFEKYLLSNNPQPLILSLDEVDRLFVYPELAADFLSLLRAWYEKTKTLKIWQQLRLIIVYATEVYIPLNLHESPFNVGQLIELHEFTAEQITSLAQQYTLEWTESQTQQLMAIVGGHPEWISKALRSLKSKEMPFEQLLQTAALESGLYRGELRHLWRMVHQRTELLEGMRTVMQASQPVRLSTDLSYQLHSLGLIQLQGNFAVPRCALYQRYFCDRLSELL
ncbi:Adenylate cyclase (plasmid) [Leptolyngbya boryana IAM M-101]|nr:Adenylate cyclase [Leptolyngbya boryana IAM M-101]BAS66722.1 Adenylate cyclase [Leptolyngbya boryana dg5]